MAEPLAVLLLPAKLEEFELAAHARDLLELSRVVAVEPGRWRRGGLFGPEMNADRQARRLRFPGAPRVIVLYHPRQYYLARALCARHQAELWYLPFAPAPEGFLLEDELARERAVSTLAPRSSEPPRSDNKPLRQRLVELEIISSRPFVPGAQIDIR